MGAKVRFLRERLEVDMPLGATLLEAAEAIGAPLGSHCGGVCGCSACHVYIRAGAELLSPSEPDEESLLAGALDRDETSRLACQAELVAEGELRLEISEESFESYLDNNPEDASRALELRGVT